MKVNIKEFTFNKVFLSLSSESSCYLLEQGWATCGSWTTLTLCLRFGYNCPVMLCIELYVHHYSHMNKYFQNQDNVIIYKVCFKNFNTPLTKKLYTVSGFLKPRVACYLFGSFRSESCSFSEGPITLLEALTIK